MIILPAIDLFKGCAVRLYKGNYDDMTVYSGNPVRIAEDFKNKGAEFIHMVDLEGAKDGTAPNIGTVEKIIETTGLKVEIGGGIRSMKVLDRYINIGAARVILGTAAVKDREFLLEAVKKYGDKIAVGADIRDGYIAIRGWTEKSHITCEDFFEDMQNIGIKTIICTDISKDGAMKGTNITLYKELTKDFDINIIASGGVSSMNDIIALNNMNIYGAIIGKAYYVGAIDLAQAIGVTKGC